MSLLNSCEFTQQKEKQPSQVIETEEEATPVNNRSTQKQPRPVNSGLNQKQPLKHINIKPQAEALQVGQNPNKSFHDIESPITQGRAKKPFPSEMLLDSQ